MGLAAPGVVSAPGVGAVAMAAGDLCQRCHGPGPTRWVSMQQNIGAIVLRFRSGTRGRLCRECVESEFWSRSLVTLFLGWWGMISFFTTPLVLALNCIMFLRVAGLPSSSTGRAKPIGAIVGPLVIVGLLGGMVFGVVGLSRLATAPVDYGSAAGHARMSKEDRCVASCAEQKDACLKTAPPGAGVGCASDYDVCSNECRVPESERR